MVSRNDSTGDLLVSKANNKAYDEGYDKIFRKSKTLEDLQDLYAEMKETGKTSIIQEPTTDLNTMTDTTV